MGRVLEQAISEALRPLKRTEFDRLVELGVFDRGERVELVRGVLVEMAPIGPDHDDVVEILTEVFVPALKGLARVRVQGSFAASDDSEPQPDILIIPRSVPRGIHEHPSKAVLAIEVAESSLRYDRTVKTAIYAEAGVPEYWIFDISGRAVEVYSRPVKGKYRRFKRYGRSAVVAPGAFPDLEVKLSEVFPDD